MIHHSTENSQHCSFVLWIYSSSILKIKGDGVPGKADYLTMPGGIDNEQNAVDFGGPVNHKGHLSGSGGKLPAGASYSESKAGAWYTFGRWRGWILELSQLQAAPPTLLTTTLKCSFWFIHSLGGDQAHRVLWVPGETCFCSCLQTCHSGYFPPGSPLCTF